MSLDLIKKLREQTGAGMLECQKAVKESNGTYEDAVRILREKGQKIAVKKSSRAASEGLVGWIDTGTGILVIELNCETDFVSRGEKFQNALEQILSACKESKATNSETVLSTKIEKQTVKDFIIDNIAVISENIKLGRVDYMNYDDNLAGVYMHNAVANKPNLGVIVTVVIAKTNQKNDIAKQITRKIAMHVAASMPTSLSISDVDPQKIESEKAILKEQLKDSGKSESILDKMISGKISKFFEDIVLLEQTCIFDNSLKVKDWLLEYLKESGVQVDPILFVRIKLGDFALENN